MPNENSYALPMHYYRNPAEVIENKELADMGCRACNKHLIFNGRVACTEPKKMHQKDVPRIGRKCKFFELESKNA